MSEQRILGISGKKQAGKTTVSNFLHGYMMQRYNLTSRFEINNKGQLRVLANYNGELDMAILDLKNRSNTFKEWAHYNLYPIIKGYSCGDYLKEIAIELFGLAPENLYGTNEEKNRPTSIKWSDISFAYHPMTINKWKKEGKYDEYMTGREFVQEFGSNICRKIVDDCWVQKTLNDIEREQSSLAIIDDCRFPNEVDAIKQRGGRVIRLTRNVYNDNHISETALDKYNEFDYTVNNQDMSAEESCKEVLRVISQWGWIPAEIK